MRFALSVTRRQVGNYRRFGRGNERRILKSWKEIASYLGVGIRTAQRWKQARGLPVKQPGAKRRSAVLGLSDEIDRWVSGAAAKQKGEQPRPADIVATDKLWGRHSPPRLLEREVEALLELGRLMVVTNLDTNAILKMVSAYALRLCKAESAGFSLLETAEDRREIFRWTATTGRMAAFEGGTTPADFSPCGYCLERDSPQLFRQPEKHYAYLEPISPITELLLIPLHYDSKRLGTIWVISHQNRRRFDREDARLMTDLGTLSSAALSRERPKG